jgi:hypothetical protein
MTDQIAWTQYADGMHDAQFGSWIFQIIENAGVVTFIIADPSNVGVGGEIYMSNAVSVESAKATVQAFIANLKEENN